MNDVHFNRWKAPPHGKAARQARGSRISNVNLFLSMGGRLARPTEALEPEDAVPAVVDSPMELIDAPLELPAAAAEANKVGWNWDDEPSILEFEEEN